MTKKKKAAQVALPVVQAILWLRGKKVLLDADLARLYGTETRTLVQAVKRHRTRFPDDFMFRLKPPEVELLRSQSVISKAGQGGRRHLPYAFTEQGVAMLSSVVHSSRAIAVNIEIMRAFVQLRAALASQASLARKVQTLSGRLDRHDQAIIEILAAIKRLTSPIQNPTRRSIGFIWN